MNMLLADSGSTKTEWCYLNVEGEQKTIYTKGLNPYYHTLESLVSTIQDGLNHIDSLKNRTLEICFYGAGCSLPEKRAQLKDAFRMVFPSANISINDDLLGAARALNGDQPGITSILGTGSNSCLYDGEKISENVPSLGFVLGDEGSGGYIGKELLRRFFYNELPEDIARYMKQNFDMNRKHVLDSVYHSVQPNRYVASFASVTSEFAEHSYIKELVFEAFEDFVSSHLIKYEDYKSYAAGFIGSVAFYHRTIMEQVLDKYNITTGLFLKQPMPKLIEYHTRIYEKSN